MKIIIASLLIALGLVFHALWTNQESAQFSESDEALIHEHAVRLAFEIQNNELKLKDIGKFVDPDDVMPEHIEREVLLRAILTEMEQLNRK